MTAKPTVTMVIGSVITALIGLEIVGAGLAREIAFGMLAPLVAAVISWELTERTYRRDPASVTGLMVAAFGVKVLIFGGWVVLMLKGLALQAVPFVVSFTAYFIGLHVAEALFLKRLFAEGASGTR